MLCRVKQWASFFCLDFLWLTGKCFERQIKERFPRLVCFGCPKYKEISNKMLEQVVSMTASSSVSRVSSENKLIVKGYNKLTYSSIQTKKQAMK